MNHLVRARESQEDSASVRLAFARRAQARARSEAVAEKKRVEALAAERAVGNADAFVAAAVALQSAAATHAAAVGAAEQADAWVLDRQKDLTTAATARHVAERLRDNAQTVADRAAAAAAQKEIDETAAVRHSRASTDRGDLS